MTQTREFSVSNVRIEVDRTWFPALLLLAWILSYGYFPQQAPAHPESTHWTLGFLSALALSCCVLLHEAAHCFTARQLGMHPRRIVLSMFGGTSQMDPAQAPTALKELITAGAGPVASLSLGLTFSAIAAALGPLPSGPTRGMLSYLSYINGMLGIFNLLPAFPLDGGRILRAALWHRSGSYSQATQTAARIGFGFSILLIAAAVLCLFTQQAIPAAWLGLVGILLLGAVRAGQPQSRTSAREEARTDRAA